MYLSKVSKIQGRLSKSKQAYGDNWQQLSSFSRQSNNWQCQKCKKSFYNAKHLLHSHHIIPLSKGGQNERSNLTSLCVECHKNEHY
jgi:5-methylcytosine-specific restriction endonuclease McrA